MDAKNRVTIPSEWLSAEGASFFSVPNARNEYLSVLPPDVFARQEDLIRQSGRTPAEKKSAIRFFFSSARPVSCDKQGRILLPPEHCGPTGLTGGVILAGMKGHFEIWNPQGWSKVSDATLPLYQEVADEIGL